MTDGTDDLFQVINVKMDRDHVSAETIGAAELKVDTRRAQVAGHAAQRISERVGCLGPVYRAPDVIAGHGIEASEQLCGAAPKALPSQLAKRLVQRRGFKREVAGVQAIGFVDFQELSPG